jgi:RNA polymerase-associated protein RTF1
LPIFNLAKVSSEEEFDDGMDDDLIRDEEDRARLGKMTEREREEELFKRAEERENQRKRFEIKKKMDRQKKEQQQVMI